MANGWSGGHAFANPFSWGGAREVDVGGRAVIVSRIEIMTLFDLALKNQQHVLMTIIQNEWSCDCGGSKSLNSQLDGIGQSCLCLLTHNGHNNNIFCCRWCAQLTMMMMMIYYTLHVCSRYWIAIEKSSRGLDPSPQSRSASANERCQDDVDVMSAADFNLSPQ